jgi:hypothetical protein
MSDEHGAASVRVLTVTMMVKCGRAPRIAELTPAPRPISAATAHLIGDVRRHVSKWTHQRRPAEYDRQAAMGVDTGPSNPQQSDCMQRGHKA